MTEKIAAILTASARGETANAHGCLFFGRESRCPPRAFCPQHQAFFRSISSARVKVVYQSVMMVRDLLFYLLTPFLVMWEFKLCGS